jgi:hypothetical protein
MGWAVAIHGCLRSLWATRHGMSTTDRRKQAKAKKARLQAKKQVRQQVRHEEKWQAVKGRIITEATNAVRDAVTSGKARIAVTTLMSFHTLLAAMWGRDGVQVRAYKVNDIKSMTALATDVEEHVSMKTWSLFMENHLKKALNTEADQYAMSGIEWRPGEGPPAMGSPTPG